MKQKRKAEFSPRAKDMTYEDLARWMESCAKQVSVSNPDLTPGERKILISDIRAGYKRIASALRAYGKLQKKLA